MITSSYPPVLQTPPTPVTPLTPPYSPPDSTAGSPAPWPSGDECELALLLHSLCADPAADCYQHAERRCSPLGGRLTVPRVPHRNDLGIGRRLVPSDESQLSDEMRRLRDRGYTIMQLKLRFGLPTRQIVLLLGKVNADLAAGASE